MKGVDRIFLRRYANWVLRRFVRPSVLRKSFVVIKIIKADELQDKNDYSDFTKAKAWVVYEGIENNKKKFVVVMNASKINKKAKKPWIKFKTVMMNIGHEMVHVNQYLNNELFDYVDGRVKYKGEVFEVGHSDDLEKYFNSPWERDAYGREYGLYQIYINKLKEELKRKKHGHKHSSRTR